MTTDKQIRFDGGEIDGDLFDLRREICDTFGVGYEQAEHMLTGEGYVSEWSRLLEVEGIGAVDPHALTYPNHYTSILWTAEVAGQSGPRAVDLAKVHMDTNGEIETFFYKDAYAVRAFDRLASAEEWEWGARIYHEAGSPGDRVLNAFSTDDDDGFTREVMIDDFAHEYSPDSFAWVEGSMDFEVLDPENHPVQLIHTDMMYEHTDPVTISSGEGVFKFASRGGVMWSRYGGDDAPEWAWDMARARYTDETPDGYVRVASGWHDSMSASDQSEVISGITSGDLHDKFREVPPVMVAFWGTGNVCSVGITLYTTDDYADDLADVLAGKRAVPGYAGVRP